jgi:pimeloyl-ACP methyl ester carboxylesterase
MQRHIWIPVRRHRRCVMAVLLFSLIWCGISFIHANEGKPPKPKNVQVAAKDGLTLKGDFYTLVANVIPESGASAVLLLHDLNGNRQDEIALVMPFLQEGFQVLSVDLRGFGETGGKPDWEAAVGDIGTWLAWLKQQPDVQRTRLAIIGDGIGSNLALIACGHNPECVTIVALSPGLVDCDIRNCQSETSTLGKSAVDYFVKASKNAITHDSKRPSMLLIASQLDNAAKGSIRQIISLSQNEISLWLSPKEEKGRDFIYGPDRERVISRIVFWLNEQLPVGN